MRFSFSLIFYCKEQYGLTTLVAAQIIPFALAYFGKISSQEVSFGLLDSRWVISSHTRRWPKES